MCGSAISANTPVSRAPVRAARRMASESRAAARAFESTCTRMFPRIMSFPRLSLPGEYRTGQAGSTKRRPAGGLETFCRSRPLRPSAGRTGVDHRHQATRIASVSFSQGLTFHSMKSARALTCQALRRPVRLAMPSSDSTECNSRPRRDCHVGGQSQIHPRARTCAGRAAGPTRLRKPWSSKTSIRPRGIPRQRCCAS